MNTWPYTMVDILTCVFWGDGITYTCESLEAVMAEVMKNWLLEHNSHRGLRVTMMMRGN